MNRPPPLIMRTMAITKKRQIRNPITGKIHQNAPIGSHRPQSWSPHHGQTPMCLPCMTQTTRSYPEVAESQTICSRKGCSGWGINVSLPWGVGTACLILSKSTGPRGPWGFEIPRRPPRRRHLRAGSDLVFYSRKATVADVKLALAAGGARRFEASSHATARALACPSTRRWAESTAASLDTPGQRVFDEDVVIQKMPPMNA